MMNRWKQPDYIPTPKEIEEKCEEIQRRWSERERRRRMRFYPKDSKYAGTDEFDCVEAAPSDYVPSHPAQLTRAVPLNGACSV